MSHLMQDGITFTGRVTLVNRFPLLLRFAVLLVVLAAGAWVAYTELGRSLPPRKSALSGGELTGSVSISRDRHGVPHIEASTENDAFFAIGYVHAQDRLWQLEMQRRTIHGEVSEVAGKGAIGLDVWFRTLNLYSAAQAAWPSLDAKAKESLRKYAAGVNAGIAAQRALPPEFRLIGVKPGTWTVYDSLAWFKVIAFEQSGNFDQEIKRSIAATVLDVERLHTFFPEYPAATAITHSKEESSNGSSVERLSNFYAFLTNDLPFGNAVVGSNAWAVSPILSKSGATLLANDPHLRLEIPSPWYALRVEAKALNVSGMSLVGLPLVIFGRNDRISWGGVNLMADTQDLYIEKVNPLDASEYEVDDRWEKFQQRTEVIRVRSELPKTLHELYEPVKVQVRSTVNGPIVSDQFRLEGAPISLRWTGFDRDDTSFEAFYGLQFASDWSEFCAALRRHVAPALNMVFVDRAGNIGYTGVGRIPIRGGGFGLAPMPAAQRDLLWQGFIPFDKLPHAYNPDSGFIVTANDKVVDDNYPYFISSDWASPARARRITQLIENRLRNGAQLDVDDMKQIQADTVDIEAAELIVATNGMVEAETEDEKSVLRSLEEWHGDMAGNSHQAAFFRIWMRHLRRNLFEQHLRGFWNKPEQAAFLQSLQESVGLETIRGILVDGESPWCARHANSKKASCVELLNRSFKSALVDMRKLTGEDVVNAWRWDALQQAVYFHRPFGDVQLLRDVFQRKIGNGGSRNSVNVADGMFLDKEGFLQQYGSSFRQIVGMGPNHVEHWYMNSTGQSGNVLSRHYSDMIVPFRDVRFFLLAADRNTVGCSVDPAPVDHASQLHNAFIELECE